MPTNSLVLLIAVLTINLFSTVSCSGYQVRYVRVGTRLGSTFSGGWEQIALDAQLVGKHPATLLL